MDKSIFEHLSKYNKEVNKEMNEIIKTLSGGEWDKQFAGYFKSIHELCSHIFIADHKMFKRFRHIPKNIGGTYFEKEQTYEKTLFKNISEYIDKRAELDNIIIDYVKEFSQNDLDKDMEYTRSNGITLNKKLKLLLMTIFNHETYNRGMISLYLEMLGKENDYSRFIDYV
ncbi:MAG: DinB family protein [Treponema sp.]|jgi:uncharacterized damage-inducible protein DinB|nr:DinB family protein [Treponema sp.]